MPAIRSRVSYVLHVRLFGSLELIGAGGATQPLPSRPSRHLVAFMALHAGRLFPRDIVAGTLWGERSDQAARKTLRNALWVLRGALRKEGAEAVLSVDREQIGLMGGVWVDSRAFQTSTAFLATRDGRLGPNRTEVEVLERVVRLYRGDLLDGIYAEWTAGLRENLRLTFLAALDLLFKHYMRAREFHSAIQMGRRLLRVDPFLEHVHRDLMLCYCAMGDRPRAVRQFQECQKVLREELDLEPMDETRALIQRIRQGYMPPAEPAAPRPSMPSLRSAHTKPTG